MERKTLQFTDLFASDKDKSKDDFGIKVAEAISSEWFENGAITNKCNYGTRRDWIKARRLFARGEQDLKVYKDITAKEENELSYHNLDWTPINYLGKYVKLVADGINEDMYKVGVRAIDNNSIQQRKAFERDLRKKQISKQIYKDAEEKLGLNLTPSGFIPEDDEDREMYMELKYKPKVEIAEEILIDNVFSTNGIEEIKPQINYDLTVCGIGFGKCYTDKLEGVKMRYVDPEYLVYSQTKSPTFKDAYYFGEVLTKTIGELKVEGNFTNIQLNQIANAYAGKNNGSHQDVTDNINQNILDWNVDVLDFTFKSTKDINYKKSKKKKGVKFTKKASDWNPRPHSQFSKETKTVNTWYEGNWVLGTKHIYNYKESENVAKNNLNKVMSNYVGYAPEMYKGNLVSFTSNIEPIVNKILYTDLKLQHLVSKIRPPGVRINMDKVYQLSDDSKSSQEEILALFNVEGVVLESTVEEDGSMNYKSEAVSEIPNGVPNNIIQLVEIIGNYKNDIRDITGINPFRDGTQPSDTLVGVQRMGLLQSNIATKYITRGSLFITKKLAECTTTRLNTIFKWGGELKKIYIDAVGQENIDVLESLKDRHLHAFGIVVEMNPTEEELAEYNANLQLAIQSGALGVEDKIDAGFISNKKKANAFIRYRAKKRTEQKMKEQEHLAQVTAQSNAQAATVAGEQERETKMFDAELQVQIQSKLSEVRIMEAVALAELEKASDADKYDHEKWVAQLKAVGDMRSKKYLEDRKDERVSQQSTEQSKMIKQRADNSEPIDFKNSFSGLF